MKRLPLLLAPVLLLAPATADDQTRDVQAALKSQGFYYGEVTGAQNAETDAAIPCQREPTSMWYASRPHARPRCVSRKAR